MNMTRAQAVVVLGAIALTYLRRETIWPDGKPDEWREAEGQLVDAIREQWPDVAKEYAAGLPQLRGQRG